MRRSRQKLSEEECLRILKENTHGVLAVLGDGDYPYAVPISFVYDQGRIFFHCASDGHKLDAIRKNDRVSFCVVDKDQVVPEKYTTFFRSVIVFGRACILEKEEDKRAALQKIAEKYSPGQEEGIRKEIDQSIGRVSMVEIRAEHISGKEAIELVTARGSDAAGKKE